MPTQIRLSLATRQIPRYRIKFLYFVSKEPEQLPDSADVQFDGVSRLGISDPEQFLRRKFREEEQQRLLFLNSCLLGPALLAQIGNRTYLNLPYRYGTLPTVLWI